MAQVLESLLTKQEAWTRFLIPDFGLLQSPLLRALGG